jgi:hypothetical protein
MIEFVLEQDVQRGLCKFPPIWKIEVIEPVAKIRAIRLRKDGHPVALFTKVSDNFTIIQVPTGLTMDVTINNNSDVHRGQEMSV